MSDISFLGQCFVIGAVAIVLVEGLLWFFEYERILVYVVSNHSDDLIRLGVSGKKMLLSQFFSVAGFIVWILSIRFAPELFGMLFLAVFILPAPLYMSATPSVWNYWNNFWVHENQYFGDERLKNMRARLRHMCRGFLNLATFVGVIGIVISLVGLILLWVQ